MDNSNKIILDLCGGTGSWSRPWKLAGYDVRNITLPDYDVLTYDPPDNVYGILAAPPCTEFSVLNRAWPGMPDRERDLDGGMEIVDACLRIIKHCNPRWWALENPKGLLRNYLGEPRYSFQPWWFGSDAWTKHTDIWGDFNIPERENNSWDDLPKLDLYIRGNRQKPGLNYQHKSAWEKIPQYGYHKPETDAEFRAMTPPGFARAFYEANKDR